jgi:hypothetical protein
MCRLKNGEKDKSPTRDVGGLVTQGQYGLQARKQTLQQILLQIVLAGDPCSQLRESAKTKIAIVTDSAETESPILHGTS